MSNRVSNGLKNTKVSLFFNVAMFALAFFSRDIFISNLGENIVGLNIWMLGFLDILNISELGVGTAVAALLYKHLLNNDKSKINDIVSVLGYFYRISGLIVIGFGVIILTLLPFLFSSEDVSISSAYMAFIAFFLSSLVGYFISYQQVILTADQRYYEIVSATNIASILKITIQILFLILFDLGYVYWLVLEVLFSLFLGLWLVFRVRKMYPWLKTSWRHGRSVRKQYPQIFSNAKKVIPHKVSFVVLIQTDNLILSILTSFSVITHYNNYAMLVNKGVMIVSSSFTGLMAGVGSLIAQGNMDSIKKLFWEIHALFLVIATIFAIGLYFISSPLVELWLGEEYVLGHSIVVFLSLNSFLAIMRIPISYFTNGYSLFKDTWSPWCEVAINLVVSFGFGYLWGILGVMFGTFVSGLFIQIWKPYFFYREIFKVSVWGYWREISKYLVVFGIIMIIVIYGFVNNGLFLTMDNYLGLLVNSVSIVVLVLIIMIILLYPTSQGMKDVLQRFIGVLIKRI